MAYYLFENLGDMNNMRFIVALVLTLSASSLAQGQTGNGEICAASVSDLQSLVAEVDTQEDLDGLIAEIKSCSGLSVFKINQLLRIVAKAADANANVVTSSEAIQVPLPKALINQGSSNVSTAASTNRKTASASS